MIKQAKWVDQNIPSLSGENFIITGASSGVGKEAAISLLYKGATVYFAVRNKTKTEKIIEEIKKEIPNAKCEILLYDQSSQQSIVNFLNNLPDISVKAVILNAAIYFPAEGSLSEDGTGLTFYTNCVGTHLLFEGLRKKYPSSRFVFTNSVANFSPKNHDFGTCIKSCNYTRGIEYGVSKRSVMNLFGYAYENYKDVFVCMTHPGVSATNIIGGGYAPFVKKLGNGFLYLVVHKPWKACLGEVYLAAADNVKRGDYMVPRGLFHISGYPIKCKLPKNRVFKDANNLLEVLKSNY